MFFHVCNKFNNVILKSSKKSSLHVSENPFMHMYKLLILDKQRIQLRHGRTPCVTFRNKGSLTIETALVLPIFLFLLIGILQLSRALQTEGAVRISLWEVGKRLSTYAYVTEYGGEKEQNDKLFGAGALTYTYTAFLAQEGKEYWNQSMVSGGSGGFSFLLSSYLKEDGYLDLIVTYDLRIPFPLTGDIYLPQIQRCRVRGWIGETGGSEEKEQMVYITESGTVYHLTKDCSHLTLTIQEISPGNLPQARNSGGGKYSPCEKCGKKPMQGKNYYITKDGDCFHTMRSCSGLKRTVLMIPISQVGGRSLCKRCGG